MDIYNPVRRAPGPTGEIFRGKEGNPFCQIARTQDFYRDTDTALHFGFSLEPFHFPFSLHDKERTVLVEIQGERKGRRRVHEEVAAFSGKDADYLIRYGLMDNGCISTRGVKSRYGFFFKDEDIFSPLYGQVIGHRSPCEASPYNYNLSGVQSWVSHIAKSLKAFYYQEKEGPSNKKGS